MCSLRTPQPSSLLDPRGTSPGSQHMTASTSELGTLKPTRHMLVSKVACLAATTGATPTLLKL